MRDTIFEDYDIKMHGGNDISLINYEENIAKMRIAMRQQSYLSKPEVSSGFFSLSNKELNQDLSKIVINARKQRQENILNVIRRNDFESGYQSNSKINVFKEEVIKKLDINYETQLRILIASEENIEMRENLRKHCQISKSHPNFDKQQLVYDIISNNYSFH